MVAWSLRRGSDFKDLCEPSLEVEDVQFIPESNQLAVCGGSEISLWNPESLIRIRELGKTDKKILCLAASRDGSTLAAGTMNGVVRLYDLRDGGRQSEWKLGSAFNVYRIALSPDGRLVAAIDRYNSEKHDDLYVMDSRSGKRLEQIRAKNVIAPPFLPMASGCSPAVPQTSSWCGTSELSRRSPSSPATAARSIALCLTLWPSGSPPQATIG